MREYRPFAEQILEFAESMNGDIYDQEQLLSLLVHWEESLSAKGIKPTFELTDLRPRSGGFCLVEVEAWSSDDISKEEGAVNDNFGEVFLDVRLLSFLTIVDNDVTRMA